MRLEVGSLLSTGTLGLVLIGINGDKLVNCMLFGHVLWPNIITLFIYLSVVFNQGRKFNQTGHISLGGPGSPCAMMASKWVKSEEKAYFSRILMILL